MRVSNHPARNRFGRGGQVIVPPPPAGPGVIVCDGDSLTEGYGGVTGSQAYPGQLDALIDASWVVHNVGISGQHLDAMQASRSDADGWYGSGPGPQVLSFLGGTNDIGAGDSAATVESQIQAYCTTSQGVGWKVIVCTLLPRDFTDGSGWTHAMHEAVRAPVNTWLRANWHTFADALCDLGADSRIGLSGCQDDTTYYQADKTHLTVAGAGVVAQLVANQLNNAIA